ncbi:MAG TPA: Sec-independent protein translocase protein TatB [Paracoccaceae bacterium]|nr:Sec-independent protein translocase protein TatB [Paracoccaceae bacterium]
MFDIGWTELLVLGAIALIVVGPKDLPGLLRTLGQTAGKARRMAREFQSSMEDAAREADVSELRDVQKSMSDWNRRVGGETPKRFAERMAKQAEGAAGKPAAADPAAAAPAPASSPAAPAPASSPAAPAPTDAPAPSAAAEAAPAAPAPQPPAAADRPGARAPAETRDAGEAAPRRDA